MTLIKPVNFKVRRETHRQAVRTDTQTNKNTHSLSFWGRDRQRETEKEKEKERGRLTAISLSVAFTSMTVSPTVQVSGIVRWYLLESSSGAKRLVLTVIVATVTLHKPPRSHTRIRSCTDKKKKKKKSWAKQRNEEIQNLMFFMYSGWWARKKTHHTEGTHKNICVLWNANMK